MVAFAKRLNNYPLQRLKGEVTVYLQTSVIIDSITTVTSYSPHEEQQ